MDDKIKSEASELVGNLQMLGFTFATAESCTGGAVSHAVTSVAGCSSVMRGAVVAYHNDVKVNQLGVSSTLLEEHGAVSGVVAEQMVRGVARVLETDCAVATTGIAGPGGGSFEKPVGTVWIAAYVRDEVLVKQLSLGDQGRENNVRLTVLAVIRLINEMLSVLLFSKNKK